jgi:hypothetical protein
MQKRCRPLLPDPRPLSRSLAGRERPNADGRASPRHRSNTSFGCSRPPLLHASHSDLDDDSRSSAIAESARPPGWVFTRAGVNGERAQFGSGGGRGPAAAPGWSVDDAESGPGGNDTRSASHAASCSNPNWSIPASRRLSPLPWRIKSDPRRSSMSVSLSANASEIRSPPRHTTRQAPGRAARGGRGRPGASRARSPPLVAGRAGTACLCCAAPGR